MWFFFFKQKTAYEMRISDWSSDVCSSDLLVRAAGCRRMGKRCWHCGSSAAGRLLAAPIRLARAGSQAEPARSIYRGSSGAAASFYDRKSVVKGKSASVRVDLGGRRISNKTHNKQAVSTTKVTSHAVFHRRMSILH